MTSRPPKRDAEFVPTWQPQPPARCPGSTGGGEAGPGSASTESADALIGGSIVASDAGAITISCLYDAYPGALMTTACGVSTSDLTRCKHYGALQLARVMTIRSLPSTRGRLTGIGRLGQPRARARAAAGGLGGLSRAPCDSRHDGRSCASGRIGGGGGGSGRGSGVTRCGPREWSVRGSLTAEPALRTRLGTREADARVRVSSVDVTSPTTRSRPATARARR